MNPDEARAALRKISRDRLEAGDLQAARQAMDLHLAIDRRTLHRDDPELADSLVLAARLHAGMGDYESAISMLEEAAEVAKRSGSDMRLARSLLELGDVHVERTNWDSAASALQRAEVTLAKVPSTEAASNLAELWFLQGIVAEGRHALIEAEEHYDRVIGLSRNPRRATGSELIPLLGMRAAERRLFIWEGHALKLFNAGSLEKAEAAFQRILGEYEKGVGTQRQRGAFLLHYADLKYATSDHDAMNAATAKALEILEPAFRDGREDLLPLAERLANTAGASNDAGLAVRAAKAHLALARRLYGTGSVESAHALTGLGESHRRGGDFDAAEEAFRQSLAIYDTQGATSTAGKRRTELGLLGVRYERGEITPEVLADLSRPGILDLATAFAEDVSGQEAQGDGRSLRDPMSGDLKKLSFLLEAGDRNDRRVATHANESDRKSFESLYLKDLSTIVTLHLHGDADWEALGVLALRQVLRRKGLTREVEEKVLEAARREDGEAGRALIERLGETREALSRAHLESAAPEYIETLQQRERVASAEAWWMGAEAISLQDPVEVDEVIAKIPAQSALLEYVSYDKFPLEDPSRHQERERRYAVYILRPGRTPGWQDLGPAAPIDTAISDLARAARDPLGRQIRTHARAVHALIVQPVNALLSGAERWIVAPDDRIGWVPFPILIDSEGKQVLDHVEVSFVPSGRFLVNDGSATRPAEAPVIMAAPAFGEYVAADEPQRVGKRRRSLVPPERRFSPLPGARAEAAAIMEEVGEARLRVGSDASESEMRKLHGPRVLHIATHAFFLGSPTEESETPLARLGVALSGANARENAESDDDGILTALEMSALDLVGTRLVVLSACDTALGETTPGEGVVGFDRALAIAGARSRLLSLWKVDDSATRDFMIGFYRRLAAGETLGAAVRASQRMLRERKQTAHPFYWGAFILAGDPGSLSP